MPNKSGSGVQLLGCAEFVLTLLYFNGFSEVVGATGRCFGKKLPALSLVKLDRYSSLISKGFFEFTDLRPGCSNRGYLSSKTSVA